MVDRSEIPRLLGLVLAGGRSSRMGSDKGSLSYGHGGIPQVSVALGLLRQVCDRAWVSIGAQQRHMQPYASLDVIVDADPDRGPAGGVLSAFSFEPAAAWLVLAVDMPRVSINLLTNLVHQRDSSRIATVHCHADGVIEPLCAIWEPASAQHIRNELEHGRGSLRAVAREAAAAVATLPRPERLQNVNTPEERSALLRRSDADGEPESPTPDEARGPRW
jgi:molybdopterin-guanine dinucleotide biosynthesis protein A